MKSKPELGLNAEEFGAAFQQVWPELSGAEMESVFSKVDATADGLPTPTPTLTPSLTPTLILALALNATLTLNPTLNPTLTQVRFAAAWPRTRAATPRSTWPRRLGTRRLGGHLGAARRPLAAMRALYKSGSPRLP